MPPSTLWSDEHRNRLFLIPEGIELPIGELRLRTSRGRDRWVQPSAVLPYEVDANVANTWVQVELSNISRQLAGNLRNSLASAQRSESPQNAPPDNPATPGLDLFAAITETPRADLDTGALGAALKRYFGDIGGTVADAVSGDPARIARAKVRMAEWSATLREHGTEVSEPQPADGPTPETGATAGAAPAGAATQPPRPPDARDASGFAARLRELAEQFRRRADALATAREGGAMPPAAPQAGEPTSAADQPEPPSSAETQAAALEALAAGIEDAAGDAAARLRAHAARLRRGS